MDLVLGACNLVGFNHRGTEGTEGVEGFLVSCLLEFGAWCLVGFNHGGHGGGTEGTEEVVVWGLWMGWGLRTLSFELRIWTLVLGAWNLEFGTWNLALGTCVS
ncbi:MAG: hypothetical protein WBA61_06315 [Aequorivita sp.]